ncbi:MAG: hypothetical protein ABSG41_12910 [Bryobacteraceae bacterium]|jgi:hypothetical protein
MTFQDTFTIAVILTIAVCAYLFRDGGPGTPKRIKVPIPRPSSW